MKFRIAGVDYDAGKILDAPINDLIELHDQTGLEGSDILAGLADGGTGGVELFSHRSLMAITACVWLGRRKAGEKVSFQDAVAGLSMPDIEWLADGPAAATGPVQPAAPDPTRPASGPGTPSAGEPLPSLPSLSPGQASSSPSTSTP